MIQHLIYVPLIEGTTRRGRQSIHVARFVHERLQRSDGVETELLDLE